MQLIRSGKTKASVCWRSVGFLWTLHFWSFGVFVLRPPVEFGLLLPAYNFALVALNYYIVHEVLTGSYGAGYSYVCTPLKNDSYDPNEMKVKFLCSWLLIAVYLFLSKQVKRRKVANVKKKVPFASNYLWNFSAWYKMSQLPYHLEVLQKMWNFLFVTNLL